MRVLTRKEKIESFVVAPLLFLLGVVLFIYSVRQESVDVGYVLACLMFGVGSGISLNRDQSLVINLMIAVGAMQMTQWAFFDSFEISNNRSTLSLQFISVYCLSLIATTNLTWLIKGKPQPNNPQSTN